MTSDAARSLPAHLQRPLAFSQEEYRRRLDGVMKIADARGFDALVVTVPENICYITGFQSVGFYRTETQFLILPVRGEPSFVLRFAEQTNLAVRSWLQRADFYRDFEDPIPMVAASLRQIGCNRIGIDLDSWLFPASFLRRLEALIGDAAVLDSSGVVEEMRLILSAEEIACVERACAISSDAVPRVLGALGTAGTDRDLAAVAYGALLGGGSEYLPDPPDTLVGPETSLFHWAWSGRAVERGDVLLLDFAAAVNRYLGPISRSGSLGEPPAYVRDRYKVILEALDEGTAVLRPGVTCAEAYDAFARPLIAGGYEVPIKLGYAVGIAFPPRRTNEGLHFLPNNSKVLMPGMVIHTLQVIRVLGDQSPACGDTILITDTGHRVLTTASREFGVM